MADPAGVLVPVTSETKDQIERVDDTANRATRTGVNTGTWSAIVYALNRWTAIDFTAEDLMILLPVLVTVTTYLVNFAEFHRWIPSTKTAGSDVAAPTNAQGQILGEVKA